MSGLREIYSPNLGKIEEWFRCSSSPNVLVFDQTDHWRSDSEVAASTLGYFEVHSCVHFGIFEVHLCVHFDIFVLRMASNIALQCIGYRQSSKYLVGFWEVVSECCGCWRTYCPWRGNCGAGMLWGWNVGNCGVGMLPTRGEVVCFSQEGR